MTKILVLAPHTDDGEFGCGGTIAKLTREGHEVIYVAFSAAEQSVPDHLPRDILRKEVAAATRILNIEPHNLIVLNFEVRKFPQQRQQILEEMVRLNRELSPSMVFLPTRTDTHQDHQVISEEGFRAFKRRTMFGYEVLWNNLDFRASCFFTLSEEDVAAKVRALAEYKSQAHRAYATEEFVRALAVTRGTQIGERYAEAFDIIRYVVR
jgi:LmbE family N-acetylglucosaminyl deacetylase